MFVKNLFIRFNWPKFFFVSVDLFVPSNPRERNIFSDLGMFSVVRFHKLPPDFIE